MIGVAAFAHFALQAGGGSLWSAPIQQLPCIVWNLPVSGRARFDRWREDRTKNEFVMRAETQNLVDEIKQAISLLRRHL